MFAAICIFYTLWQNKDLEILKLKISYGCLYMLSVLVIGFIFGLAGSNGQIKQIQYY